MLGGLVFLLIVIGILVKSDIEQSRRQKNADKFIATRSPQSDADFVQSLGATNSLLATNVRKLSACVVEIPSDYIYADDCLYAITAELNPREDFTDRFHDFAMFSLPDNFEISESETLAQIIKRLEDLNVSGT